MKTIQITKAIAAVVDKKSILPATCDIHFTGKHMIFTDLDVWVNIPHISEPMQIDSDILSKIWSIAGKHINPTEQNEVGGMFKVGAKTMKVTHA